MNSFTKRSIVGFILLCFLHIPAWSTAQYPENIEIDGKMEAMMATPLEDFWNESRPKPDSLLPMSTACWRGYIGSWEIKDDLLILVKLEERRMVEKGSSHEVQMFAISKKTVMGAKTEDPLPAVWFSGVLRIARGKQIAYVHMGFGSVYEEDLFIFVERGKVIRRVVVKNDPAKLTSASDLGWRELGNMTDSGAVRVQLPEDAANAEKGDWLSFYEIGERYGEILEAQKPIRVRGIFFPGRLWFPPQGGMDATFNLDTGSLKDLPSSGAAVELLGTLRQNKNGESEITVSEIRELPAGEPIQRKVSRIR
jgi:hypothetical protein